jgi:hypothetical protein
MKEAENKVAKRGRPPKKTLIIDEPPSIKQSDEDFLVMRVCNNPSWVIVRMDGLAVPVKCPSRLSNKLVGKRIKVCLVSAEPEDFYEYAS